MSRTRRFASFALALFALPLSSHGQFSGHYPSGVEGVKGASVPPPGIYLRDYNLIYHAERLPGGPGGVDTTVYVNAPRLIWMTDWKILGADYGMDLIVPFGFSSLEIGDLGVRDSYFGLYDIQFEPLLLGWHFDRVDVGAGYAIWAPTGDSPRLSRVPPRDLANLGKGFWSHMLTAGATVYFDKEKTWALSALNRYEIHHECEESDVTTGNSYTLEWGLSKTVAGTWDIGISGYFQQQTTEDSGRGAAGGLDSIVGIGPEVSVAFPKLNLNASLRWLHELGAEGRTEGDTVTLTVTRRF